MSNIDISPEPLFSTEMTKMETTTRVHADEMNPRYQQLLENDSYLKQQKADALHEHTISEIKDFPDSLPANGGNANTLGGLDNNKFVQWIGAVNLTTLNDAAMPLNYEGDISETTAKAIGLPENWWHVKYQRHTATSGGFGVQQFIPLNAPNLIPRYRTSMNKVWDTMRPMSGDLVFKNKVVNVADWVADTSYTAQGYNFKASIQALGGLSTLTPNIVFAVAQQFDENIAPIVNSYDGGVIIYAKTKPTSAFTIPEIRLIM